MHGTADPPVGHVTSAGVTEPHETRLKRAIRDTSGFREAKGRRAIQSVIGAGCAVLLLLILGSPSAASDEALAYVGVTIGVVLLANLLEFGWHYLEVPHAILREDLDALRAEVRHLPEVSTPPERAPRINARAGVLLQAQRGRSLLDQSILGMFEDQAWTENTAQFLGEHVGAAEAEEFLEVTDATARDGIRLRVNYLTELAARLKQ